MMHDKQYRNDLKFEGQGLKFEIQRLNFEFQI